MASVGRPVEAGNDALDIGVPLHARHVRDREISADGPQGCGDQVKAGRAVLSEDRWDINPRATDSVRHTNSMLSEAGQSL